MPYCLLYHFLFLLKRRNIPCHLTIPIPCLQVVFEISHVGGGSAAINYAFFFVSKISHVSGRSAAINYVLSSMADTLRVKCKQNAIKSCTQLNSGA